MKIHITAQLCLVLGIICATMAKQVAVRSTFASTFPDVCTDAEFNIALTTFQRRRNLRGKSRRLQAPWYCSVVCRDFARGTCKLAYRECVGFRRLDMDEEEMDHAQNSQSVESTTLHNRDLQQNLTELCELKIQEVDAAFDYAIENLFYDLSQACINTLSSPRTHVCINLIDQDGDGQFESSTSIQKVAPKVKISTSVNFGRGCSKSTQKEIAGDPSVEITYCFTVCNTGETFLNQFMIQNPVLAFQDGSIGRLPPNECRTVSMRSTIPNADLKNVASVTANPCDKDGYPLANAKAVTSSSESTVKVTKTKFKFEAGVYLSNSGRVCGPDGVKNSVVEPRFDEKVTYCFMIQNTGTIALTANISNPDLGLSKILDSSIGPSQVRYVSIETTARNFGKYPIEATAYPVLSTGTVVFLDRAKSSTQTLEVKQLSFKPKVSVLNTVYEGSDTARCKGGLSTLTKLQTTRDSSITYCFAVSNQGDSFLSIRVANPLLNNFDTTLSMPLAPGMTTFIPLSSQLAMKLKNKVTVTGTVVLSDGFVVPNQNPVTADMESEVIPV